MAAKKAAKAKAKKAKKRSFKSVKKHADIPKIKGVKLDLNQLRALYPKSGVRVVLRVMEDGDGPGGKKKKKPKLKEYRLHVPSTEE